MEKMENNENIESLSSEKIAAHKYRSEDISKLVGALSKAQGGYKPLVPNEVSAHGKFANLAAIINATRPSLSENGLCFYQYIELLDDGLGAKLLISIIAHESGQFISSIERVIKGENIRHSGMILESHKRTHAYLLLGIAPSENDPVAIDDDGEELVEQDLIEKVRKPKKAKKPSNVESEVETINNHQYKELLIELENFEELTRDILSTYRIDSLCDLPKEEYHKVKAKILKIKRVQEEYELKRSKR